MIHNSHREYLEQLDADLLHAVMSQSESTAAASKSLESIDRIAALMRLHSDELKRYYPGLMSYVLSKTREIDGRRVDEQFTLGYAAGAMSTARAITLAAEADDLPTV